MSRSEILWELLEMEALEKFFVGNAKSPAFLLFPKYHWASTKSAHSLYLSNVGLIARFSSQKKALDRIKELVEKANYPLKLYQVSKFGRKRGKQILFAENKSSRIDLTKAKGPVRAFNIDEWEQIALKPI